LIVDIETAEIFWYSQALSVALAGAVGTIDQDDLPLVTVPDT
jgi:hypothetical protein